MTRRVLTLTAVVAALAVPTISWADGGSGGSAPIASHDGSRLAAHLDRFAERLDRRFKAFSSRCLVANAPKRCAVVADRAVRRMDKAQAVLSKIEGKLKAKCAEANPPALCANLGTITGKIDALLATLASDEAAIKAAYPTAGSGEAS